MIILLKPNGVKMPDVIIKEGDDRNRRKLWQERRELRLSALSVRI